MNLHKPHNILFIEQTYKTWKYTSQLNFSKQTLLNKLTNKLLNIKQYQIGLIPINDIMKYDIKNRLTISKTLNKKSKYDLP